jgi:LPXTG-motif cell wall-anchored protein
MGGRRIAIGAAISVAVLLSAGAAHAGGAVTANPDTVHTSVNTPVDFDPSANDTIGSGFTFSFNEIESSPNHGTATVNPDNKTIHYVPDKDYTGPDSMEYNVHVCQQLTDAPRAEAAQSCTEDTGEIAIQVDPAAVTTTTTVTIAPLGTTVAPTSSTTVAAAAAAAQLPRTGTSSGLPVGIGIVAVAVGAGLIIAMRRRATR